MDYPVYEPEFDEISMKAEHIMDSLAQRIRDLREERGWSQLHLANRMGVTNKVIWKYEAGKTVPRLRNLMLIAWAFGLTVDQFLDCKQ